MWFSSPMRYSTCANRRQDEAIEVGHRAAGGREDLRDDPRGTRLADVLHLDALRGAAHLRADRDVPALRAEEPAVQEGGVGNVEGVLQRRVERALRAHLAAHRGVTRAGRRTRSDAARPSALGRARRRSTRSLAAPPPRRRRTCGSWPPTTPWRLGTKRQAPPVSNCQPWYAHSRWSPTFLPSDKARCGAGNDRAARPALPFAPRNSTIGVRTARARAARRRAPPRSRRCTSLAAPSAASRAGRLAVRWFASRRRRPRERASLLMAPS
jgi:hypothetical protein